MLGGVDRDGWDVARFAARGQEPEQKDSPPNRSQPEEAQKLIRTALEQYEKGNLDEARAAIRSSRKADPFLASAFELEASIALDSDDVNGYRVALERALDAHPRSATVQNSAGKHLVQSGLTGRGLKAMKKAVELSPRDARYARDLAATYMELNENAAAQQTLMQALHWNPQDKTMPVVLARFFEATEDWQPAAHYYTVAVGDDPTNLSLRRQQARSLYQLGEFSRACDAYSACIASDDSAISLAEYARYGDACLQQGDVDRAQMVYDRIARYSPVRSKEVEMLRAICAIRRSDTTRARGILQSALTVWPQDRDLLRLLAVLDDDGAR